jgi:hypothetical protein
MRMSFQTTCILSREGPSDEVLNGIEDILKAITISAKATPITIPRFLERAKKLVANPNLSRGREPMIALLFAGLKSPIPIPRTNWVRSSSKRRRD